MSNLLFSSIGKKFVVSLSGCFLLIFLLMHLGLNLTAIISKESYDAVCHFMDVNPLVQAMVPVLVLGFLVHIIFACNLEFKNWTSRPRNMRYAVPTKTKEVHWSAKNMFVLGVLVIGFLFLHLAHFWSKMQLQHFLGKEGTNAYEILVYQFSQWYYCLIYIVWFIAIYFHVSHGFWSAFQSLGLNNAKWLPRLKVLAKIYALVVLIGYVAIPLYFFFCKSCCCQAAAECSAMMLQ